MKKRLEADLISIAHRILKLKDRAEIDQLQQETLKLYEKLSVLKFVEDNFKGATPTIGHASALFKLEDVYGLNEDELVKPEPGELDKEADEKAAARKAEKEAGAKAEPKEDKENESGEGVDTDTDGRQPVATKEKIETEEAIEEDTAEEGEPKPEEEEATEAEEPAPAEEEKPEVEEPRETPEVKEPKEEPKQEAKAEEPKAEASHEEPEVKVQVEKPAEDVKAEEASAAAVYQKGHDSSPEEEEKAIDAEIKTIEPDANTKAEEQKTGFNFAFERTAAPETPAKQKEISFEDFQDYKEPEFVKKDGGDAPKAASDTNDWRNWQPAKSDAAEPAKQPEAPKQDEPVKDWRDWNPAPATPSAPANAPATPPSPEAPKAEEKDWRDWEPAPSAPKAEAPKPAAAAAAPKSFNDGFVKAISLGLNDRIAFEKNLFNGSSDDLNRVISQLNTFNSYQEAQNFIEDLVKPDYNNWKNKEEYEERFMVIVEKRFS